jgi:RimJ/RimL family protein N-acetyltransferase
VTETEKFPKQTIRLDCGDYVMRTVTVDDASDRWGRWLTDPVATRMLNARPKVHTKAELVSYVASFDQRTRILLGTFKKDSGLHLGITKVDIDEKLGHARVSGLIGEPDYRRKGVTKTFTRQFREYFFETLGLKMLLSRPLSHNQPSINYLTTSGYHFDKRAPRAVKSFFDDTMLDLLYFSLSREAWRAWKMRNVLFGQNNPVPHGMLNQLTGSPPKR